VLVDMLREAKRPEEAAKYEHRVKELSRKKKARGVLV
jgi:predicted GIY-YIG superfamily endonuclease